MENFQLKWQQFVLKVDRWFSMFLYVAGAIVIAAAQDPSWTALLGKWGGVATVLIGVAAGEIRRARDASSKKE